VATLVSWQVWKRRHPWQLTVRITIWILYRLRLHRNRQWRERNIRHYFCFFLLKDLSILLAFCFTLSFSFSKVYLFFLFCRGFLIFFCFMCIFFLFGFLVLFLGTRLLLLLCSGSFENFFLELFLSNFFLFVCKFCLLLISNLFVLFNLLFYYFFIFFGLVLTLKLFHLFDAFLSLSDFFLALIMFDPVLFLLLLE